MTAPAIILSHPQLGENIGAAARAMKNFGLSDLRLVNPRDGWPNIKANHMAAGASDIVDNVKLFGSLKEAIADLQFVIALGLVGCGGIALIWWAIRGARRP